MKRSLFFAIILATVFAYSADAQFRFGIQSGANFANLEYSDGENYAPTNRLGFLFGARAEYQISRVTFLYLAPTYISKGADVTYLETSNDEMVAHEINYFEIPVGAKLWLSGGQIHPYLFAGAAYAFNMSDDGVAESNPGQGDVNSQQLWKDSDLLLQLGVGFEFMFSHNAALTLDLKYSRSMSSIAEKYWNTDIATSDIVMQVGVLFRY